MMMMKVLVLAATAMGQSCKDYCTSMKTELPQALDCRQYRMMLPRPKVGNACTKAYDKGAEAACIATCEGLEIQKDAKMTEHCRDKIQDYPKPTVHKACRTGYALGFEKGAKAAEDFKIIKKQPVAVATEPVAPEKAPEAVPEAVPEEKKEPASEEPVPRKLLVTMPVTLDDEEVHLEIFDDADPAAQLDAFCGTHMADSIDTCVKQLTPHIQRKLQKVNS